MTTTANYGITLPGTAQAVVNDTSRKVAITGAGEFDGTYTLPAAPIGGWVIERVADGFVDGKRVGVVLLTDHDEYITTDLRLSA